MSVMTITYPARCKDCVFLKANFDKKKKRHFCSNPNSDHYEKQITLRDLVCNVWKWIM